MSSVSASTQDTADAALVAGRPKSLLKAYLLSVNGFIYGKDYDFGDRVTVQYDGRQGDALIRAATISMEENSKEQIDISVESYLA